MFKSRKFNPWVVVLTLALAGCGGGGGGDSAGSSQVPDNGNANGGSNSNTDNGSNNGGNNGGSSSNGGSSDSGGQQNGSQQDLSGALSGFASKGILQYATVKAYEIDSTGKASTTVAGTAETDAQGNYTISALKPNQSYLIEVKANSRTVHLDEVTEKPQTLSSDFVLSAVADVGTTGTTTASVTPFSHQIVEAAKSAGSLNPTNVGEARKVVKELVGFDPVAVTAPDSDSAESKQLKVMLRAVSQMVKDGALGCGSATDKTACVTDKMAKATKVDTLKLKTGDGANDDVSAALESAVTKSIQDLSRQDARYNDALVLNFTKKLKCADNDCKPSTADANTLSTVEKVRAVLNELRNDWTTLFSRDGATSTASGRLNQQAFAFKSAMENGQGLSRTVERDLHTVALGVNLYRDYVAGRTSSNARGSRPGDFDRQLVTVKNQQSGSTNSGSNYEAYIYNYRQNAVGCSLYSDSARTVLSTSVADANFVGCSSRVARLVSYDYATNRTTYTDWRHGFSLTPNADGTSFEYVTSAGKMEWSCPGTPSQNSSGNAASCSEKVRTVLQKDGNNANMSWNGRIALVSESASGKLEQLAISGDLAPAFTVASDFLNTPPVLKRPLGHDTWQINASASYDSNGDLARADLAGTVSSRDADNNKLLEMQLLDGSHVDVAATEVRMNVVLSAFKDGKTAKFEGELTASSPVTDRSGTSKVPSMIGLRGTLSNTVNGTPFEFASGRLDLLLSGWSQFDATQAESANNTAQAAWRFDGSIAAPNQPRLVLGVAFAGKTFNMANSFDTAAVTYSRYVGDKNTRSINVTAVRGSDGEIATTLSESGGVSMVFKPSIAKPEIKYNGTKMAELNRSNGLVTYSDGTVMSFDLGL